MFQGWIIHPANPSNDDLIMFQGWIIHPANPSNDDLMMVYNDDRCLLNSNGLSTQDLLVMRRRFLGASGPGYQKVGKLIIIKTKRYKLMRRLYWLGCLMLQRARPNLHISPSAPITSHKVNMSGVSPFTLVKTAFYSCRLILNRVRRLQRPKIHNKIR